MRATTYSILAAFFSLAPLCEAANAGAQARPKYYFPREADRDYGFAAPAEKRAPQVDQGTTVVVVPVTVYVGPDGKKYTLGGQAPTPTIDATVPKASATPEDEDPEESPNSSPLGGIKLGLPNIFSAPSASITGNQGVSFDVAGGTGFPAQTPTPSPSSSSSSKGGLLDGFPSLELPPIIGTPTPPIGTGRTTATTTSDSDSTTPTGTASETETESESKNGPIFTLPPLFPSKSSSSSSSSTDSATDSSSSGSRSDLTDLIPLPTSTSTDAFPTLDIPTLDLPISLPPILTPTPSPSSSIPVTLPPGNTTTDGGGISLPPFPTATLPPPETTDPIPSQNSSSTVVIPTPSTTPSGVFPNPTDRPTGWVPPPQNSTMVTPTTTSAIQTPPPPPPSEEPQKPISTDSLTSMIIPTSIIFQPTPVPPNPSETTKPTALPRIISPDSGIPQAPANSRLIQIGFNSSLSYEFVVSNRDSNIQIFKYAPLGVGYGLQITPDRVTMQSIQPYDILQKRAYTTALALMYIPENLVNELSVATHNPFSLIYQHPDPSTAKLMSLIDPSIPLIPGGGPIGQETNPGSGGSGGDPRRPSGGEGGSEGGDNEPEGPGGSGASSSVKATSVGIGLGVVGGAALYGAAMFFVARRYRKKRKLHRRTSSLTSGMGEIGVVPVAAGAAGAAGPIATDALMSGGRSGGYTSPTPYGARDSQSSNGSGSGRNQMISAPVTAENSLGWN